MPHDDDSGVVGGGGSRRGAGSGSGFTGGGSSTTSPSGVTGDTGSDTTFSGGGGGSDDDDGGSDDDGDSGVVGGGGSRAGDDSDTTFGGGGSSTDSPSGVTGDDSPDTTFEGGQSDQNTTGAPVGETGADDPQQSEPERGTSVTETPSGETVREDGDPVERVETADRGVGVTRGPEGAEIVRPAERRQASAGEQTSPARPEDAAGLGPNQQQNVGDALTQAERLAVVDQFGPRQLELLDSAGRSSPEYPTTGVGAADAILAAEENPAVTQELTQSGGLFAESGDSGPVLTELTGVSERDLRDPEDNILPGILPTREQVRRGGTSESLLFAEDAERRGATPPSSEGPAERAAEGAATAGLSILNVRQRAADAEQIIEGVQNAPGVANERGSDEVAETVGALVRKQGEQFVRRAQSEPLRTGAGVGLDVFGGAVALGRTPSAGDLRAEVDPRIGFFGETIESRALGLRDRGDSGSDAGVEFDASQTRGDQVSRLPGERPQTLDPDTVDEARGISGPSQTTLLRGRTRRGISRARQRAREEADRLSVDTRVGAGLGSVEVRRESGGADADAPTDFSPSRDELLSGSPRDRISDDIADRQQTARRQSAGDFEATRPAFNDDGPTFDPTTDRDARSRREAAEQRSVDEEATTPDREAERTAAAGLAGALVGGALDRIDSAQRLSVEGPNAVFGEGIGGRADAGGDVFSAVDEAVGLAEDPFLDRDTFFGVDRDQDPRVDQDPRTDVDADQDPRADRDTFLDQDVDSDVDVDSDLDPDADADTRDPDPRDPSLRDPDRRDPDTPFDGPLFDEESDDPLAGTIGAASEEFVNPVATAEDFLGGEEF
jgi:hypothetical protein